MRLFSSILLVVLSLLFLSCKDDKTSHKVYTQENNSTPQIATPDENTTSLEPDEDKNEDSVENNSSDVVTNTEQNISSVTTYTENSSINIQNPDRGFYLADYTLSTEEDYNIFEGVRESGHTLVYAPIYLYDYTHTSTLANDLLNTINKNLENAESLNVKLILRIKYRDGGGQDPAKEIILSHLNQLKPILQNHKDIISVVQAGVIGAYGEWHSFSDDYADDNNEYLQNRRAIVESLIDIFPKKYIQIRTPMHKEQLYGSSIEYTDESSDGKITSSIAFSDDKRAKIGHHNDCFLSDETDSGTYPSENISFWRNYVINDSKYSPIGGETCDDNELFTNCTNAIKELKTLHWSYINESYHPDVIQRWKNEGCYEEISENIGYRLVAKDLSLEQSSKNLNIALNIDNKGYAAPYTQSDVKLILKDINTTDEYLFELNNIDLRTFYAQESNLIQSSISLNNINKGEYCLYIKLSKNYANIKLSNLNMWNDEMNANLLKCGILIK